MSKVNMIKWLGMLGSVFCAAALAMKGQPVEAIGVVTSALSSAGIIAPNA